MPRRCTKSVGYETREDAEQAIARMARTYGPIMFKRAYWCGKHKAWHVTST
jgi:hypothetical protein